MPDLESAEISDRETLRSCWNVARGLVQEIQPDGSSKNVPVETPGLSANTCSHSNKCKWIEGAVLGVFPCTECRHFLPGDYFQEG